MSKLSFCVILPTHNHVTALDAILTRLEEFGVAAIVIDDGSTPENGERIATICARHIDAECQRHAFNGGKGFAVMCGLARAREIGFTHAIQIDADGQHDPNSVDALIKAARNAPQAIVTGVPQYDATIPRMRRIWRPLTNFWVHINTLSFAIDDAMCGFRVYPVAATLDLVRRSVRSRRMDFDTEVLVKAYWKRMEIVSVPVKVIYPNGNFSNFDLLRDNVLLSLMQARLFFGMLLRAPVLLFRRRQSNAATRWPAMPERGAYWGLRILAGIYRLLGRTVCIAAMTPVILYFLATGREQRQASQDYLARLWQRGLLKHKPNLWTSFRHFLSFGGSALDKLAAWTGDIPIGMVNGVKSGLLEEVEASGRGVFVITAHIGNPEVIRAVSVLGNGVAVNVLMHAEHAKFFNRLITEFSPQSPVRAFPVTRVGVDTAILLSEAIARGEWVVMVGDRVPVAERGRVVDVPFLGELASFPQGPFILASLLKAPTYLMFCARQASGFDVHFSKFADLVELPRADRVGAIRRYATAYAKALEERVAQTPLQWFNFYSFWRTNRDLDPDPSAVQRATK